MYFIIAICAIINMNLFFWCKHCKYFEPELNQVQVIWGKHCLLLWISQIPGCSVASVLYGLKQVTLTSETRENEVSTHMYEKSSHQDMMLSFTWRSWWCTKYTLSSERVKGNGNECQVLEWNVTLGLQNI
jgi:hypothetical protein